MKKNILFLLSVVAMATMVNAAPVDTSSFKEPIRVACVGDSITAGYATSKDNSYPAQLGRMLGKKWVVKNFGRNATTLMNQHGLPYQKVGPFKAALQFLPNVVVIKLGTNDTRPENWKFKEEFIPDYKNMIDQFAQLSSKPRIFICYPAPNFIRNARRLAQNEPAVLEEIPMIDKVAADEKVDVIDIHGALKDHPELFADGLHPNDTGATVMAKTVYKALTGREYTGADPVVAVEKKTP